MDLRRPAPAPRIRMGRRPPKLLLYISALSLLPSAHLAATCPYDLHTASAMMPTFCYANSASPSTGCCWYVFAAYIYAATRHANLTGAAFLPSPVSSACSSSFSSLLIRRGLVQPSLLSSDTCSLTGTESLSLAAGSGPCRYPTVTAIRSAVDLSSATRLCSFPNINLSNDQPACSSCQTAVISSVFDLLRVTNSKEFVPCGMAATIAIWSGSSPNLSGFRSYALCMGQVLENVGALSTANLTPSAAARSPSPSPSLALRSPVANFHNSHSRSAKIAAGSAALGLISIAAISGLLYAIRRKPETTMTMTMTGGGVNLAAAEVALPTEGLYIFTKPELKQATNGYDDRLLLGKGGAGKVYLGKLPSGQHVAVKRIYTERKLGEFYREVQVLAKLRHRNLATLVGYCLGKRELALVYEYMAGGNLEAVLHGGGLPWRRRVRVAVDVAEGLAYLHDFPEGAVVHRDVKPTNVLLSDAEAAGPAKLSDFGVSRIVPVEVTHVLTELRGTVGYIDPETFYVGQVSEGADVYSFGVMLLELVTGMRAVIPTPSGGAESIVQATRVAAAVEAVVDHRLGEDWDRPSVGAVFETACRCVRPAKEDRPGMAEVLAALKRVMAELASLAPSPPTTDTVSGELSAASASTPSVHSWSL